MEHAGRAHNYQPLVILLFVFQLVFALEVADVLEVEWVATALPVEPLLHTLAEHVDVAFVDLLALVN